MTGKVGPAFSLPTRTNLTYFFSCPSCSTPTFSITHLFVRRLFPNPLRHGGCRAVSRYAYTLLVFYMWEDLLTWPFWLPISHVLSPSLVLMAYTGGTELLGTESHAIQKKGKRENETGEGGGLLSRLYADLPEIKKQNAGNARGPSHLIPFFSFFRKRQLVGRGAGGGKLAGRGHDRPFFPVSPPHGSLVLCGPVLSHACRALCFVGSGLFGSCGCGWSFSRACHCSRERGRGRRQGEGRGAQGFSVLAR